jgi:hypothetical protein
MDEGVRSCLLINEGRKYLHILPMDFPLQVKKVPLAEGRYMRVMENSISRALKSFRRAAKAWHGGIRNLSEEAQRALRRK